MGGGVRKFAGERAVGRLSGMSCNTGTVQVPVLSVAARNLEDRRCGLTLLVVLGCVTSASQTP